ncbi:MAG TPA: MerR family transcriptional regulator [Thermoanaerobaculia bacterium]|nr:MerR family transcriptional regulator [Thermoanaerobaculia bacterium]
MPGRRRDGFVMISIVSERYNIHPQTLRLYEREGLLKPTRTGGNTRLYGPDQLRRLELILRLTRDIGVNLAGVEVILGLFRDLEESGLDVDEMIARIRQVVLDRRSGVNRERALVKVSPRHFVRTGRK